MRGSLAVRALLAAVAFSLAGFAHAADDRTPVLVNPPVHPFNPPGAPETVTGGFVEPVSKDARDFTGIWVDKPSEPAANFSIGVNPPAKAETVAIYDHRRKMMQTGKQVASPHLTCRPTGVDATLNPHLSVIVMQTKNEIVLISEEDRNVRHIYLDRPHPANLTPTYMGHSIGRWEGDTLVVDTVGYNDLGWMDELGMPASNQLHMIERITKRADGAGLDWDVTLDDPKYFDRPFRVKRHWVTAPGVRQLEYDCELLAPTQDRAMNIEDERLRPICRQELNTGKGANKIICSAKRSAD